MTLRLIGAGWPRTGTSSIKLAYEQLGLGRCYHMREVFQNIAANMALWIAAADGAPDWEAIFAGYTASTDTPGCMFWRELVAFYPDAKVLLSVREPDEWFDSTQATVMSPAATARIGVPPLKAFFDKVAFRAFAGRIHDRAFMTDAFRRHNDAVMQAVPADRLLVYRAAEGWGPLCALLGVPVPDTPFPHANTREEMMAMMSGAPPADLARLQEGARRRFGPGEGR